MNTDGAMAGDRAGTEAGSIIVAGDEIQAGTSSDVDMSLIGDCDILCPEGSTLDNCECVFELCECPAIYEPVCGVDNQTYGNLCEAECGDVEVKFDGECSAEVLCSDPEVEPNCMDFCETVDRCLSAYCMYPNFTDRLGCAEACENDPDFFLGELWYNHCYVSESCEDFTSSLEADFGGSICGPECTEPNPDVMYVSNDTYECETIDFGCRADAEYYYDECGCGCYMRDCEAECGGITDEPVCSPSGTRYASECYANCSGEYQVRPCETECVCPAIYEPECGLDGVTYDNRCLRECVNVPLSYSGACGGLELCTTLESRVDCDRLCDEAVACFDGQCGENEQNEIRTQCNQLCSLIGPNEICDFATCFDIPFLIEKVSTTYIECIDFEIICPDEPSGAEYISYDSEACGLIGEFNCEDGEPFSGPCGCGCLNASRCPREDRALYINYDPDICEGVSFYCPDGSEPFNNQCGCGCSF